MSLFGDIHIHIAQVHVHALDNDAKAAISQTLANTAIIIEGNKRIMATQDDAAAALESVGTKLDKISGETTDLVAKVAALQAAANEAGNVSPRLQAAIDALSTKADQIDALVDDIAPNPTPTPDPVDPGTGGDTGAAAPL